MQRRRTQFADVEKIRRRVAGDPGTPAIPDELQLAASLAKRDKTIT
jgi:hypothetical protein